MERYNESTKCSKCGGYMGSKYNQRFGYIDRTCVRCGYSIRQLPLDSKMNGIEIIAEGINNVRQ